MIYPETYETGVIFLSILCFDFEWLYLYPVNFLWNTTFKKCHFPVNGIVCCKNLSANISSTKTTKWRPLSAKISAAKIDVALINAFRVVSIHIDNNIISLALTMLKSCICDIG